jgi:hypothetical protein
MHVGQRTQLELIGDASYSYNYHAIIVFCLQDVLTCVFTVLRAPDAFPSQSPQPSCCRSACLGLIHGNR